MVQWLLRVYTALSYIHDTVYFHLTRCISRNNVIYDGALVRASFYWWARLAQPLGIAILYASCIIGLDIESVTELLLSVICVSPV